MTTLSARGSRVIAVAAIGAAAGAHVAAALFFADHDPYESQILPPCPVLQLTGWQCPGCGSTRALYSLLHGDVAMAFTMNPLLLACYGSTLLIVGMAIADRTGHARLGRMLSAAAIALVAIAALYTGVVRNLV